MLKASTLFFGKLPSHGDFLRYNAAGPEIRAFDLWLQEAIYKASRHFAGDWPRVFRDSPAYDFVFHADGAEAGLAGALLPSRDLSGRQFPFIVAGVIGKRDLGRAPSLIPLVFAEFFRGAHKLAEEAVSGGLPLSEISSGATSLASSLAAPDEHGALEFEAFVRSTTWGQVCERLFGSFETPRKYLLAQNLIESLRPSSSAAVAVPSVAVRFPLTPSHSQWAQEVSFWNGLGLSVLEGPSLIPSMFWGAPVGQTSAYHFFSPGKAPARLFVSLVQPGRVNDGVCRLDEDDDGNGGQEGARLPQRIRIALENPDIALEEFLRVF